MKMAVIGITAHIFNHKSQQLERILLGLRRIEHPHTAEKIKELTYSILYEWSIPHKKVWCIITDNAKNITKAFQTVSLDGEDYANVSFIEEGSNGPATAVHQWTLSWKKKTTKNLMKMQLKNMWKQN